MSNADLPRAGADLIGGDPVLYAAFEGVDGSGKTTLLEHVADRLRQAGLRTAQVGKRADAAADAMTELIVSKAFALDVRTEAHLRVAREYQRLEAAPDAEVVLLDRSLPSLASMIEVFDLPIADFEPALRGLRGRMRQFATVLCAPPFAVARERLERRTAESGRLMSKKEAEGFAFNERIGRYIEQWAADPSVGGTLLRLDTDALAVEVCAEKASAFILGLRGESRGAGAHGR